MFQLLEMRPLHAPEVEPDVTVPAEYGTDLLFELETDQEPVETTEHIEFDSAGALGLMADGRLGSQEDEPEDEDFFDSRTRRTRKKTKKSSSTTTFETRTRKTNLDSFEDEDED